jgi:hypothetical protein
MLSPSRAPLKQVLLRVDVSANDDGEVCEDRKTHWDGERPVEFVQDTHFVGGLSPERVCDGVFVATYRRVALGTKVHLGFELPDGQLAEARGVVRWTRETDRTTERPGLGIAFTDISDAARSLIDAFCRSIPPLYFEL